MTPYRLSSILLRPGRGFCAAFLLTILSFPFFLEAQGLPQNEAFAQTPVAVALPVLATAISYGDLVDYDPDRNIYVLSQFPDDPYVYGIAVEDPPVLFSQNDGDVPIARSGAVLVNITIENGAINRGDRIVASSYPGKAMRAATSSKNIVGMALEAFPRPEATSTSVIVLNGRELAAGTILVELEPALGRGITEELSEKPIEESCSPVWKCIPMGVLMRYLTAALVAFGSVYLAFRSFMQGATSGVASIGRNPRAKATIQSMVVFNAFLAVALALAGLAAGLVILFIDL